MGRKATRIVYERCISKGIHPIWFASRDKVNEWMDKAKDHVRLFDMERERIKEQGEFFTELENRRKQRESKPYEFKTYSL